MGDVGSHRCSPNACRPRVPCRMTDARFLENELHKGRGQQPPRAGPRRAGAGRPALRHRTWKSDWSPLTTERPVTAKPRGLRATAPGELGKPLSPDGARPGGATPGLTCTPPAPRGQAASVHQGASCTPSTRPHATWGRDEDTGRARWGLARPQPLNAGVTGHRFRGVPTHSGRVADEAFE